MGLDLVRKHLPDILFLDLMLPDINGFDVCRQIRQDRAIMLTTVVIVTALSDMQHRVHGFRVGANAYVVKPYGLNELFEAIEPARSWRARMEREPREGEITVTAGSEIALLQGLNDLYVHLSCSTPYSLEEAMEIRQVLMEMSHIAIEWGLREKCRVSPPDQL